MKKLITLINLAILSSCTDATYDAWIGKLNDPAKVKCYSGTLLIYEGESTGAVKNADQSDGYQFREKGTNNFLEVSGNCIITYEEINK